MGMLLALIAGPAQAADSRDEGSALRAVERVVGSTPGRSASVTLPSRANEAVKVRGSDARGRLEIKPVVSGSRAATASQGFAVVSDASRTVVIQQLENSVRLFSVIADSSSATSTSYAVTLPAGESLELDPLGGVVVLRDHKAVGRFNAPWAIDSTDKSLPTSYTLDGNTITQTVDTAGAVFPVVADPHYTWGITTGTVYFNVSETQKMAASAAFVAGLGAFLPPPFDLIVVASAGSISLAAAWALADHKCIDIKSDSTFHEYGGSKGDGYCK